MSAFLSVTDYDFRQMDQMPNSDLLPFRGIQETFGQRFGADLSAYLRKEFVFELQDLRQVTWGAHCESERFSSPACLLTLKSQAHQGHATLELAPSFVFSVLEILLGGKVESVPSTSRELTSIERKLLDGFFRSPLRILREIWTVDAPDFVLDSVISSPASSTSISRQEPMVLAEFLLKAEGVSGHICLAVPTRFVRQRRQESVTEVRAVPGLRRTADSSRILKRIQPGKLRAETVLTQATIRMGDLAALEPGDVLNLGYPVSSPLSMRVNGTEVYTGFVVPIGQRRAFSISAMGKGTQNPLP